MGEKMSDEALLDAVLGGELTVNERDAFAKMKKTLPRWGALTPRQRAWAEQVGYRVGKVATRPDALPERAPASAWDPEPSKGFRQRSRIR